MQIRINSGNGFAVTCPNYALHAAQHRTQIGADTTTAPKMGAKLKAQGAQELRSDLSLTTQQARARTHTRHCATMSTASDSSSAAAGRPGSRVWSLRSERRTAAPAISLGGGGLYTVDGAWTPTALPRYGTRTGTVSNPALPAVQLYSTKGTVYLPVSTRNTASVT